MTTQYTIYAVSTTSAGNTITVSSVTNMFPGLPIVFSGNTFGGITANSTYYVGTVIPGYPTSVITVSGLPGGANYALSNATGNMTAVFSQGGQQIISTTPPGESLTDAFTAVNVNFDQIFAAGPVNSNIQIANNSIVVTNPNGNINLVPNGIGNVIAHSHIQPDQDRVRNLGSANLRWNTVYTQYFDLGGNLTVAGNISATGNISGGYFYGNGSQLTGLPSSYGNANVVTLLSNLGSNSISTTGNITAGQFFGDGSQLSNVGALIQSNTAPPSPTSSTLWWDEVSGALYVWYTDGSGSQWVPASPTGVPWTSVASNIIPATDNTYSLGNATNQWASVYIGANTLYLNNVPVGVTGNTLTVNGANVVTATNGTVTGNNISVTGNVTANAITLKNTDDFAQIVFSNDGGSTNNGQIKVDGGTNMVVSANNNFYVKRVGQDRIAVTDTTSDFMAATNVRIQSNKTGNTNTWTFDSSGNLSLPGAVNYQVSGLGNSGHFDINSWYPVNINTGDGGDEAISTWNFGYNGTLTLPGNILMNPGDSVVFNAGTSNAYISQTMGLVIAGENGIVISVNDGAGNVNTVGIDANANIQTPGSISATGNITGNYIFGNGSQLTGLPATYGNANVTALLSSGSIDTPIVLSGANGNITGYNFFVGGNINAPGEFTSVNFGASYADYFTFSQYNRVDTNVDIVTTANLSAIGNVLGANFVGNVIGSDGNSVGINSFYANGSSAVSFAVGADGNVNIQTYQGAGLAGVWTFDNTGVLTIAGNINGDGASPAPSLNGFDTVSALTISAAGNVYGNYFVGNVVGNLVKGANSAGFDAYGDFVLPTSVYFGTGANMAMAVTTSATGATIAATQTGQNLIFQTNSVGPVYHNMVFDNTGNLLAPGIVSATGGVYSNTIVLAQGNIRGGNLISSGLITATGNISGNYILGNGSQLTGLPATYGNANVATFLASYGSNSISTSGNITAGNVIGNINVTGNVIGTSSNVTLVAGIYNWTFDNTGNLTIPAGGDILLGNTQSTISAAGNITGGYIFGNIAYANGVPASYGNANLANIGANNISTTGNISAGNFIGNGASLTNVTVSIAGNVVGSQANVGIVAGSYTWTFDNTGNLNIPATGDIILSNSQSMISAVGNINAGNVNVTGNVITPNRPAFRVYGNSSTIWSTTTNTNGILNANNWVVDYNQGGYLNSSTGVFTAPVAGLYQLNLVCRVANNTSLSAQAIVIKNYGSGNVNQVMWESANNPTINHFGVSTTSKLAAGDTLTLKITVGSLIFDSNDNWSVAFLG